MSPTKTSSGVWLCVAIGVFAVAFPVAFYRYARQLTKPAGTSAQAGVPLRPVGMVSVNLHRAAEPSAEQVRVIRAESPDFVFLHEARGKSLPELKRLLGGGLTSAAYFPLQNLADADNDVGVAILSKFTLDDARPVPNHMNGACGVWASTTVDGRRFYVAGMRVSESDDQSGEVANFAKAWESLGRPPIVAVIEGGGGNDWVAPKPLNGDVPWFHSSECRVVARHDDQGVRFVRLGP